MADVEIALVLAPPFIPDEPHLGLAILSALLRDRGYTVAVHDLSIRLFHAVEPEHHHFWDRSTASAQYWQRAGDVQAFADAHRAILESYLDEVLEQRPRIVGFSCHMSNSLLTMTLVELLRQRGPRELTVVAGGPAFFFREAAAVPGGAAGYVPCMYGHTVLDDVEGRARMDGWFARLDGIVLDEGEGPLLEICERVLRRDERDLAGAANTMVVRGPGDYAPLNRQPPIRELSTIPFPDFVDFDLSLYLREQLPTLWNRGCIKRCTCCTERFRWGKYRGRRAEEILAELKHNVAAYGIHHFNCYDMLLNAHVGELRRLCELIIAEGLEVFWYGNAIVRKEMTAEMFQLMYRAGARSLIFGIESGSPRIVERIAKGFTLDVGEQNLRDCHDAGIRTCINIIIGFPGETEEDFAQTIDFVRRNRASIDWIILMAMFEIFHHTDMVTNPQLYDLRPEDLVELDESFGLVEWSDTTGNTYEVRKHRFARMQCLLAELGLPDPTMQGEDLRRSQLWAELLDHDGVRGMMRESLRVDPTADIPLDEVLTGYLESEDSMDRVGAARMLGMIGSRKALAPLHRCLHDPVDWVRGEAALALGRIGHPSSIEFLHEQLTDEVYPTLSPEMRHCLAKLRRIYLARLLERQSAEAARRGAGAPLIAGGTGGAFGLGAPHLQAQRPLTQAQL